MYLYKDCEGIIYFKTFFKVFVRRRIFYENYEKNINHNEMMTTSK